MQPPKVKNNQKLWESMTPRQQYDAGRLFRRLKELKLVARERLAAQGVQS